MYAAEGRYLADLSGELKLQLGQAAEIETGLQREVKAQEEAAREATQKARDAEESLAELRKIHAGNALERDRAEREHIYKSDQIVNLNNRCESLRGEIVAIELRLKSLAGELERLRTDEQHESAEHERAESALRESEESHRHEAESLAAIEASIELLRASLMQHAGAAERFDETAYDRQVSKIEELRGEMFKRMGQDFKQTAKEFSPEERRMLADLLRRPPPSS